jgi:7-cyano-7-deazaguanine synthase in queuosine biosynthesis
MIHIISATGLVGGEQLGMCGYVFPSYQSAVDAGHTVGNYIPRMKTLSAYHERGVECESCIVRHARFGEL